MVLYVVFTPARMPTSPSVVHIPERMAPNVFPSEFIFANALFPSCSCSGVPNLSHKVVVGSGSVSLRACVSHTPWTECTVTWQRFSHLFAASLARLVGGGDGRNDEMWWMSSLSTERDYLKGGKMWTQTYYDCSVFQPKILLCLLSHICQQASIVI